MTEGTQHIRASRMRIPRTRGALSGLLLIVLGAWAGVVAFIAPYFDLAYTPAPNSAWYWTAARGYLEVAPGAAAFLGGLLLLMSASRATTSFGGWLAAVGGAWLVVGPSLAGFAGIGIGVPDPTSSTGARAAEQLLFFYGVGAAILFVAAGALGRLSVHSVRDVRAAERRAAAEEAALAEGRRLAEEQAVRDREAAAARDRDAAATRPAEPVDGAAGGYRGDQPTAAYPAAPAAPAAETGRHQHPTGEPGGYPAGDPGGYPAGDPGGYRPAEQQTKEPHHWWSRHHRRVGSTP
jgi:hypothetical protein